MGGRDDTESPYQLTVEGMRGWLEREKADVAKATELRIAEATNFVEAFARKEISQDELENRTYEYSRRWGEALPGVGRSRSLSDEEILKRIDATRDWQESLRPGSRRSPNR